MMTRLNWFLGMLFIMAAGGALINPPPYIAIALLFFLTSLMILPAKDKLIKRYFKWQIKGGIKGGIVLVSLILICLITPQVETNTTKLFTSPIAHLQ